MTTQLTTDQLLWKLAGWTKPCSNCGGFGGYLSYTGGSEETERCRMCNSTGQVSVLPDSVRGNTSSTSFEVWLNALADLGFYVKFVRIGKTLWVPVLYHGVDDAVRPWRDVGEGATPLEALLRALDAVLEAQKKEGV